MHRIVVNVQTGEQEIVPLTAEEITEIQNHQPSQPTLEQQRSLRSAAYVAESDPLFFKYQAGEVSKEEWMTKREEIRQRFPYAEQEIN